ncbi:MAG: hypothetical protein R3281_14790 [Balneolaceae bacterium]|nr:hypothetical protein [Balneolaceae bacterium]
MKKKEWLDQPVEKRRQWYISQITELRKKLDLDSYGEAKASPRELLKKIKTRMVYDGTPSDNRHTGLQEHHKGFYRDIYRAYKTLPNVGTDREEWSTQLEEVLTILN